MYIYDMYTYISYPISSYSLSLKNHHFWWRSTRSNLQLSCQIQLYAAAAPVGLPGMLLIGAAKKHRWRSWNIWKISRISRFVWEKIAVLFSKMSHIITYHHFFGRLGVMNEVGPVFGPGSTGSAAPRIHQAHPQWWLPHALRVGQNLRVGEVPPIFVPLTKSLKWFSQGCSKQFTVNRSYEFLGRAGRCHVWPLFYRVLYLGCWEQPCSLGGNAKETCEEFQHVTTNYCTEPFGIRCRRLMTVGPPIFDALCSILYRTWSVRGTSWDRGTVGSPTLDPPAKT